MKPRIPKKRKVRLMIGQNHNHSRKREADAKYQEANNWGLFLMVAAALIVAIAFLA
jgi:hypothetical protein